MFRTLPLIISAAINPFIGVAVAGLGLLDSGSTMLYENLSNPYYQFEWITAVVDVFINGIGVFCAIFLRIKGNPELI
jgi:hypothetical protein